MTSVTMSGDGVRPWADKPRNSGAPSAAHVAEGPGPLETPQKVQVRAERIFQAILQRLGRDPHAMEHLRSIALATLEHVPASEGPVVAALTHARVQGMVADLSRRQHLAGVDRIA